MKLVTLYISAAYLAALVTAQTPPISITSPLENTRYRAGQEAIISWVNPSVKTITQIVLAKGSSTSLQPVLTIATNVNADDLKYVWKIPMEIPEGRDYAFEIGTSPDIAFTGVFSIEGGTGGNIPSQSPGSSSSPAPNTNNHAESPPPSSGSSSPPPSNPGSSVSSGTTASKAAESPNVSHTSSATTTKASLMTVGMIGLVAAVQHLF